MRRMDAPLWRTEANWRGSSLRVLASGSSGNCSILRTLEGCALIDLGLSPRRTRRLLGESGLEPEMIRDVLLTHLDHDHFHPGWARALPDGWTLRPHRRHLGRARRAGALLHRTIPFDDGEAIPLPGAEAVAVRAAHDSLGAAAFRIETGAGSLGFATDVGRADGALVRHLRGVGLLAIESNYCPDLQAASPRPAFLKARITGGTGHLSNQESAEAARRIGAARVVLLHLSRQCNRPERASAAHAGGAYEVVLTDQHRATDWIDAGAGASPAPVVQRGLFERARKPAS